MLCPIFSIEWIFKPINRLTCVIIYVIVKVCLQKFFLGNQSWKWSNQMKKCCMKKKFGEKGKLMQKKKGGVQKRRRQYLDFICDIISILGYEIYNFIFTWNQQLFPIHNQLIIMHPHPPTPKIFL